jgi:hypothetical protein
LNGSRSHTARSLAGRGKIGRDHRDQGSKESGVFEFVWRDDDGSEYKTSAALTVDGRA